MKKLIIITLSVSLVLLLMNCINHKPQPDTSLGSGEEDPWLKSSGNVKEETITITGFGYGKNASQKMAETMSRNFALASLGEQTAGSFFTYNTQSGDLSLEAGAESELSNMRDYKTNTSTTEIGKYWEALTTYETEAVIQIPARVRTATITLSQEIDDMNRLRLETVKAALKELLNRYKPGTELLTGKIFLQKILIQFGTDQHTVTTTYFIAY